MGEKVKELGIEKQEGRMYFAKGNPLKVLSMKKGGHDQKVEASTDVAREPGSLYYVKDGDLYKSKARG